MTRRDVLLNERKKLIFYYVADVTFKTHEGLCFIHGHRSIHLNQALNEISWR